MKQMRKRLFAAVLSVAIACSWCVPAGAACAHRYTTVEIEAVEPTCDTDGAKAKIVCVECDKVLQKNSIIKKLGHNYKDKNGKTVWASSEEGHWQQCTVCGEPKEVIAHKYKITDCEKRAVCTDKNCNYSKAPGEHDWKETVEEPTCTEPGTLTRTCTVCQEKETEEIPVIAHNFESKYGKDANGHWLVCSNKGCKEIDKSSREAHDYGDITCDESAKCAVCGTSRKKGQHNFVLDSVNEEEHVYVCSLKGCNATKTSEHDFGKAECGEENVACLVEGCDYVIEKVEHVWKESVKAATCTKPGTLTRTCTVCKEKETEKIPVTEHNFEDKYGKDANGHWLVCSNKGCKAKDADSYEPHNYGDIPCEQAAKCAECGNSRKKGQHTFVLDEITEDGHEYVCVQSSCDERKTEPHDFGKIKCGAENVTCKDEDCGYTVAKVEHIWGEPKVKAATCSKVGSSTKTCKLCKEKAVEEIPTLEHNFEDKYGKDANGHWLVCSNKGCKAKDEDSYEPHNYGDVPCDQKAKCVECGNSRKKGQHAFVLSKITGDGHVYVCTQSGCGETEIEEHDWEYRAEDKSIFCEPCGESYDAPQVYEVHFVQDRVSAEKGDQFELAIGMSANGIAPDDYKMTFTTSNKKVATVKNGVVKVVGEGEATITVTVTTYVGKTAVSSASATCIVTTEADVPVGGDIWFSDPDVGYLMMLWEWIPAEEVTGFDYYQVLYYNDDSNRWECWLGSDINNNMVMVNEPGCHPGTYTKVRLVAIDEEPNADGYWDVVREKTMYEEDINLTIGVASGAPTVTINKESGNNYSVLIENLKGQNDSAYEFMTCNDANGNGERWGQTMPTEGMGTIQLNLDWPHFETGYYRVREFVNMEGGMNTASFDIRDSGWNKCFDCGHTANNDHPVSNIRMEGSWIVWDEPAVKNNDYGYSVKASQDGGKTWTEESFQGGNQTKSHFMRFAPGHYDTIEIKTFLPEGCCDHEVGCVTASIDLTVIEKKAAANASVAFIPLGGDSYSIEINGFTPGNWGDIALAMDAQGRDSWGSYGTSSADSDGLAVRDEINAYWPEHTLTELLTEGYYDLYEFNMQYSNNGKSVTMTRITHGGWTKSVIASGGGGGSVKTYPVKNVHFEEDGEKYGPVLYWDVPSGIENRNIGYDVELYHEGYDTWLASAETRDAHLALIKFSDLEAGHYTKVRVRTMDWDRDRVIGRYEGDVDLTVEVENSLQAPTVVLEDKDSLNGDGYPGYRVWITGTKKDWRYGVNFLEGGERYGHMRYIKVDETGLGGCEGTVYLPIWDESELDRIEFSLYAMDGHTVDKNGKVTAKMIVADPVKADFIWEDEPVDALYFRAASIGLLDYLIPKDLEDDLTRLDAAKLIAAWGGYDLNGKSVSFDDCQDLTAREQSIISTLMEEEVVLSTGPDSWSPDTTVSKSAFAMIIYRGLGSPDGDIVGQNWQLNIFKWISKVGIMQDGVGINSVITQEQALEYLMEAAQLRNTF